MTYFWILLFYGVTSEVDASKINIVFDDKSSCEKVIVELKNKYPNSDGSCVKVKDKKAKKK